MGIGAVSSSPLPVVSAPEAGEGPGPDKVNDHDADDGATSQAAPPANNPPGVGTVLDVMA